MSKNLLIVESPKKCGKIKSYLGADYTVMASVGHIWEIPKKGINIDIQNGFEPTYEVSEDKKGVVKKIKEAAEESDKIYLATDQDREGEAISFSIYSELSQKSKKKCKRITFTEITKKAILDAIAHPRDIDQHQVDAQRARQVLDRLIGYKVSPLLWRTVASKTSAGRVQSVALKLVCDRQKEIDAFKSEKYWFIEALFGCQKGEFWTKAITKDKDNRYFDDKLSQSDFEKLQKASFVLSDIERTTKNVEAHPPFDTNSLQTTCASVFGWKLTKSKEIAQQLYTSGKITYIRTDSFDISEEALKSVRELINKAATKEYLPSKPNVYKKKSSAAAQEAHECIRPTDIYDKGDSIEDSDEQKMYRLVRDRFIACQMTPMIVDAVAYTVKSSTGHSLIARGQTIRFDGWSKVYSYSKTKEEVLPDAKVDEKLELKDINRTEHTTQPPPRFNEASLSKKMESEGVGRPATRDVIIESIQKKTYVEPDKKGSKKSGLVATDLGMGIYDYLGPKFKDFFMDIKYTSHLEEDLDLIADGKKTYLEVLQSVYEFLSKHLKEAEAEGGEKKSFSRGTPTGVKCPVCKDGDIVERNGKFGKFFTCTNYPKCISIFIKDEEGKFSVKNKPKTKDTGKRCTVCKKGSIVMRNGQYGEWWSCNNFPKCKTIFEKDGNTFVVKGKKQKESVDEEKEDVSEET